MSTDVKMRVAYVVNAPPESGVGLRAFEMARRLRVQGGIEMDEFYLDGENLRVLKNGEELFHLNRWPGALGRKSIGWMRLGWKLKRILMMNELSPPIPPYQGGELRMQNPSTLPYRGGSERYDVVHLTNQSLSFMAGGRVPAVVTVHDIIEVLEPQQRLAFWINKYLYSGIRKASRVVAVSEYTAKKVSEHYALPADKIKVIYNGTGDDFYEIENFEETVAHSSLRQELRLEEGQRVVLYVGSDHPRKNVTGAVRVFARAAEYLQNPPRPPYRGGKPRMQNPPIPPYQGGISDAVFIKAGEPGIAAGRRHLLEEIDRLGVRDKVRMVGKVSKERLNELYNLADVLIYPSRFEGFGFPPLQAMAAGTPVICSNATSLPEVVGDAARLHEPDDVEGMAESIVKVLIDKALVEEMRRKGRERAKLFSWERAVEEVIRVYEAAAGG